MADDGRSTSFGAEAGAYDRGRPSYPDEAVAWLLAGRPGRVVDVGAGTGKLTRSLVGDGRLVTAVDPDPAMLEVLSASSPDVRCAAGTAESLPLDDGSADLVTLGQAWHWVDPDVASVEIARVLAPGGSLGLIWNIRDESVPWVARLTGVIHPSAAESLIARGAVRVGAPLGPLEHHVVRWSRPMRRDEIVDLVRSRSAVITADEGTRGRIEAGLAELLDSLRELDDGGAIELPYATHCFRARPD